MGATPARRARPQSKFEIVTMYERSDRCHLKFKLKTTPSFIVRGEIADSADVRRYVRRGEVWWSWVVGACWSPGRRVAPGRGGRCARPSAAGPVPVSRTRVRLALRATPNSNTPPKVAKLFCGPCVSYVASGTDRETGENPSTRQSLTLRPIHMYTDRRYRSERLNHIVH